jgi:hypothetical protein
VGEKIQTVKMLRNEWVENADRWVAGFLEIFEDLGVSFVKEKRLRVNMRLKKLQERVKEQQERVGEKACLLSTSFCLIDH